MKERGWLIANLGTPESASPTDVGIYLKQFLMDEYVIDIPWFFRWILVNLLIVPRRKYASAELYENIWTPDGSPLLINSQKMVNKLAKRNPDCEVVLGMRYGNPSLESALSHLARHAKRIEILPLYPQYALSSTQTCLEECRRILKDIGKTQEVFFYPEFYDHPAFIQCLAGNISETLKGAGIEYLLYSYHGLPENHVAATGKNCQFQEACCAKISDDNHKCYRAQSFKTTELCNEFINWDQQQSSTGFQSRLGNRPWLKPYVDEVIIELAKKGIKHIGVVCPSFTADCLETLEEISIRLAEDFRHAGGEKVTLIPSLNDQDSWVTAVETMANFSQSDCGLKKISLF